MDDTATIQSAKLSVQRFCDERDWSQFHSPKELAIGISTEANELLALFRFKTEDQIEEMLHGEKRVEIEDELSDTLFFILRFAQMNGIDLDEALRRKVAKNEDRYPAALVRGKNGKYDEY